MDAQEVAQAIVSYIDEHHPRLGSRLMKLRWGGLRTVDPDAVVWATVLVSGVGSGVAARSLLGRGTRGRWRPPLVPTVSVATVGAWVGLWRWDAARWRRNHLRLVVDLPGPRVDELVEDLRDSGVVVHRWDGVRRADGAVHGVSCRLRDLRRVNTAIDAFDESRRPGDRPDPTDTGAPR